jgi:hypothetical protein
MSFSARRRSPISGSSPAKMRIPTDSPHLVTNCKVCMHRIFPDEPRQWSTNPMGVIHMPGDCKEN